MKPIPLRGRKHTGYIALVSNCDYDRINQHNWGVVQDRHNIFRACRYERISSCKIVRYYMHREILDILEGKSVGHINGNTLDNRRENLRPA